MRTIAQLLLTPDTKIGWGEPLTGLSRANEKRTLCVESLLSVRDCVDFMRATIASKDPNVAASLTDEQLLDDFIVVHWAVEAEEKERRMVDWLLSGAGRHWMHWQAEQGKQPTREDVAEAMEVGP